MGVMPFDWDNSLNSGQGGIPIGYPGLPSNVLLAAGGYPQIDPHRLPVNLYSPTINPYLPVGSNYVVNPISSSVNTTSGANFGLLGNFNATVPTIPAKSMMYPNNPATRPPSRPRRSVMAITSRQPTTNPSDRPVVNGYLGGSLNKDEADEMNLYAPNRYDMPYGPSDLEWLYRLQDVDGATLTSRLSKLAPVSFLNPADGLTRRRLFSTDSWEPTGWVYANDNPSPYAGAAYGVAVNGGTYSASSDHIFTFNSRFTPTASPSLGDHEPDRRQRQLPEQQLRGHPDLHQRDDSGGTAFMANPITTEFLPNPSFPTIALDPDHFVRANSIRTPRPNLIGLPTGLNTSSANLFNAPQIPRVTTSNTGVRRQRRRFNNTMVQVQTPSLAHRDRRINLNMPLPISNDPAEPVRQKWCPRDLYSCSRRSFPPASVDTPEELAALSQFVVNIIDFRDPDCTMTRFVNTDLIVTDALTKTASNIQPTGAMDIPVDTTWHVSPARRPLRPGGRQYQSHHDLRRRRQHGQREPLSLRPEHLQPGRPPRSSSSSTGWNITRSPLTRSRVPDPLRLEQYLEHV